jgi:histidine triad (HIT) family protein
MSPRSRAPKSDGKPCAFCAIARAEAAALTVLEEPDCLAFLDHRPLFHGHCLVVPRAHCETLGDLPPEQLAPLFGAVQRLSRAVVRALDAGGSFVALNNRVSQSVPHLHVHVVPRRAGDGLRGFFWPRQRYADDAAAQAVQSAIRAALAAAER